MTLIDFIRESNRIEGLHHEPTQAEVGAYMTFLGLTEITIPDLEAFVNAVEPGAVIRSKPGLDVCVELLRPPKGGGHIMCVLKSILSEVNAKRVVAIVPYLLHCHYESLHPFTHGNGRSGRVLWLWMMGGIEKAPLGFLRTFYYQSLNYNGL